MSKASIISVFIAFIISIPAINVKAEMEPESTMLYYTFIGPVAGFGFNHITQNDWDNSINARDSKKFRGYYSNAGILFSITADSLQGDFRLKYNYNSGDNGTLMHLYYSAAGRYLYTINNLISLTAGPGLYFESPPSNKSYSGSAGLYFPLGLILNTGFDTRLIFDISSQYGFFGIGEESTKFSYGLELGFIFKVGRI